MQRAIGHTNASHPELEAELQQLYAKIVPKVELGVVTKAEADHLHSLEARTHGHTERGGLAAIAQSVAARRERQVSKGNSSGKVQTHNNSRTFTPRKQPYHSAEIDFPRTEAEEGSTSLMTLSTTSKRHHQSLSKATNATRTSTQEHGKHSSLKQS